jgi:hypothetical protein
MQQTETKITGVNYLIKELFTVQNEDFDFNEVFKKALEIEAQQRKKDYRAGWHDNRSKSLNCEFYLEKYLTNDFKK